MKLPHILCLAAIPLLTACKNEEKSADSQTKAIDTISARLTAQPETATAEWPGKYSGVLPCGDCKGIKTEIEVRQDSTYTLFSHYLGKGIEPDVYKGIYHFEQSKQMITLDAEGDHLKFQVQDGMLIKRDKFGNPEQGAEEARYYLHPVE
ncbi:MAG: copper resistance protein NlpE [Flavobacterium sp.]